MTKDELAEFTKQIAAPILQRLQQGLDDGDRQPHLRFVIVLGTADDYCVATNATNSAAARRLVDDALPDYATPAEALEYEKLVRGGGDQ